MRGRPYRHYQPWWGCDATGLCSPALNGAVCSTELCCPMRKPPRATTPPKLRLAHIRAASIVAGFRHDTMSEPSAVKTAPSQITADLALRVKSLLSAIKFLTADNRSAEPSGKARVRRHECEEECTGGARRIARLQN